MDKLKKELLKYNFTNTYIKQIAGNVGVDIIKLMNTKPTTPEKISKKLDEKITDVRSALNSLHFYGIACYKKERDEKNMYQFLWNIQYKKLVEKLLDHEFTKYKQIENTILEKQNRDYFICPNKCSNMPFEIAAQYNFKCPTCGKPLELEDKKIITKLKKQKKETSKNIKNLETLLKQINDNKKGYICE